MNEVYFDIVDDVVIKYTPIFKDGLYEKEIVMTKEIFQKCYKKWVESQEGEDK